MSRCAVGQHRFTEWIRARIRAEYENTLLAWEEYRAALASYRLHNKHCEICHERMLQFGSAELSNPGKVVPHVEPVQAELDLDIAFEIARDKLAVTIRERT